MNARTANPLLVAEVQMLIGGQWVDGSRQVDVVDPYRGDVVTRAPETTPEELDRALDAAVAAKAQAARMQPRERARILNRVADLVAANVEELARSISIETGKPIRDTRSEAIQAVDTLRVSAEESSRIQGEHVPLDGSDAGFGKIAMMLRFPVGVVGAITPYNAPLTMAVHKIGPAIAAGNTIVLKAPPQAPGVVYLLSKLFVEAGLPDGFLNIVYGRECGPALAADPRVDFVTFTGSTRAGAEIKARSGLRRVALELGGLGPVVVHDDADIEAAAKLCARHAMRLAGQSCVSVQNIHVHRGVHEQFMAVAEAEVRSLKVGDPLDEASDVGTLIDAGSVTRVAAMVDQAVAQGARLLVGGSRLDRPTMYAPTLLTQVTPSMAVACDEVFGPVASVRPYADIDAVFTDISESPLGLQCGVFTKSLPLALAAARTIRCGGIIINGTSTWRTDQLPYGGVKNSGIGREGPRFAMAEMTEQRVVVFNL